MYRALQAQGVSQRQAAKVLNVPRTTLQAWRAWPETLNTCPMWGRFLQAALGLPTSTGSSWRYLWCLSKSVRVVFGSSVSFCRDGTQPVWGASYGTQQQVNRRVAEAMVAYRQEESTRLAQDMPAPDITLTQDETFTGGLCLVGIEPASNSILRAHRRGTRSRHLEYMNGRCPGASQVQCHPIDQ